MRRDPLPNLGMGQLSLGHIAYGVLPVSTVLKGREDTEEKWRGTIVLLSLKTIANLFLNTHHCGTCPRRTENNSVGHIREFGPLI
jgi:hypothetical protein